MVSSMVRLESNGLAQIDVASELPAIFSLARALVKAPGFMPAHLRNEGEITAVILAGRELGLPPMASIRSIRLIKGNVTLDASIQLGLMVRAGCRIKWLDDGSTGVARLQLERPGHEPHVSRFSIDDAKAAKLTGNDTWQKHPAAMLRARCVTAAGKAYCPDVLAGVYLPDELPESRPEHPMTDTMVRTLSALPAEAAARIDGSAIDEETGEIDAPAEVDLSPAEQVRMLVDVDLARCVGRESLVAWARELHAISAKAQAKEGAWKAWAARCADAELAPAELAAEARRSP